MCMTLGINSIRQLNYYEGARLKILHCKKMLHLLRHFNILELLIPVLPVVVLYSCQWTLLVENLDHCSIKLDKW